MKKKNIKLESKNNGGAKSMQLKNLITAALMFGLVEICVATTWRNYVVDASSADWSSDEQVGASGQFQTYITWSSTSLYFGIVQLAGTERDFFVYISTALTGGTTKAIDNPNNTLSFPMHYCLFYGSPTLNGLYKYTASDWSSTAYTGQVSTTEASGMVCYESSVPLADLDITTNTAIKVLVYTQRDSDNNVDGVSPTENNSGAPPVIFRYFYRVDNLGNNFAPQNSPKNWRIYDFSVDNDSQGTHSGATIKNFTPNEDNNNDYVYFDFRSAVDGSYKFIIDTNNDGIFDESSDYSATSGGWSGLSADMLTEIQWDGKKINQWDPFICVGNNTTYYVQIQVKDWNNNVTYSTAVAADIMGAWSLTGFATGQVTAGGSPCVGAIIPSCIRKESQLDWDWDVSRGALADNSGNFSVYGLRSDNQIYKVFVSSDPYASGVSGEVQVSGTNGSDAGTINLIWGCRVYGTVTSFATGIPIEDAEIRFDADFTNGIPENTETDSNGYYTDQLNPGGPYTLEVSKYGYGTITQNITLTEGTTTQLNFQLAPTGSIKGVVNYKGTGLNNSRVDLYNSIFDYYTGNENTSTNTYYDGISSGTYIFNNIAAGSYVVKVGPAVETAAAEYHTNIIVYEGVETNSSTDPNVNFNLNDACVLTGLITLPDSTPIQEAHIELYWTANDKGYADAETDSNGYYSIPSIATAPANTYYLTARYIDFQNPNNNCDPVKISPYPITSTGTIIQNFTLNRTTSTISGNIINNTSATGNYYIVASATGTFISGGQMPDWMVVSPSTGAYTLPVSSAVGIYDVGVYLDSVQQVVATKINVSSGSSTCDLTISTFSPPTTISGKIYKNGTTTPLTGVEVQAWANGHLYGWVQETSASDGSYSIEYLPDSPAQYTLKFILSGYTTGYLYNVSTTSTNNDIYLVPDATQDIEKPTISYVYPAINGKILSSAATIQATLSDNGGTGINSTTIVMKIDGTVVSHSYNSTTGVVSYYKTGLSEGQHSAYIECQDFASTPLMSNLTWYFSVDTQPPTLTLWTAFDTDGNYDTNFSPNNGGLEDTMRIQFNSSEDGDYTLYIDSNNNGAYDDGLDVFIRGNGWTDYNSAVTTDTITTIDWNNGATYNRTGSWLGNIAEGSWVLQLQIDDTYKTGSSADGNVRSSSITITVDRTTLQNYIDVPTDNGTVFGPEFAVTYQLGEPCYSTSAYTTNLDFSGTPYILNNAVDLSSGTHTKYLNGSSLGLNEGTAYTIQLNSLDLAGNPRSADGPATASNVTYMYPPSAITTLSASAGDTEDSVKLTWLAPGDDGIAGQLTGSSAYKIQYSSYSVNWSTTAAQLTISTSSVTPFDVQVSTVQNLLSSTSYYFRIWTTDEYGNNWSALSNAATCWTLPDITPPGKIPIVVGFHGAKSGSQVSFVWPVTGDNGYSGDITGGMLNIKYSSNSLATPDTAEYSLSRSSSWIQGTVQEEVITGLQPGTTYYFWARLRDEVETNWSVWSDSSSAVAGSFMLAWSSTETDNTTAIAWGDYDNDGFLDQLVGNDFGYNRVYHNNGSGTFTPVWTAAVAERTQSVAWGDYDNDGDLDMLIGNYSNEPNRIYCNDGNGTFTSVWTAEVAEKTLSVAWGDYDNDGDLDILVGNENQANRVYRNNGNGTFTSVWTSAETEWTFSVAWGDYDNDGDLDQLVGNDFGNNRVYRNNGNDTFTAIWNSAETERTLSVAWGDYDNDGDLDQLVGNWTQTNRVYRNNGNGTFTSVWNSAETERTSSVAWGDYDNDGDLDQLVGNGDSSFNGTNRIYRNNGNDTFISVWTAAVAEKTLDIAWGDYDNDGDLDQLVGNYSQTNRVYKSLEAEFQNTNTIPSAPSSGFSSTYNPSTEKLELRWADGSDTETTPPQGLYYDVRIATAPITDNLKSWIVSPSTGAGTSPFIGNYPHGFVSTSPVFQPGLNLKQVQENATYYWQVRTIDTGLRRSSWSTEQSYYWLGNAPAAVTNLIVTTGARSGEFYLSWSMPGDDGWTGTLPVGSKFAIQYSTNPAFAWTPITAQISVSTSGITPGTTVFYSKDGLLGATSYYFRIWHCDEVPNWSALSNAATCWTSQDSTQPDAITTLYAIPGANEGEIQLSWTATGDDGIVGQITDGRWRIAYSTDSSYQFSVTDYKLELSTSCHPLSPISYPLSDLILGATYYIRIWLADETLINWSDVSNAATSYATGDTTAPSAVTNLIATAGWQQATLTWTAPGDDGITGPIVDGRYEIKYATTAITDENNWNSATYQILWSTDTSPGNTETKIVTGLTNGTTYYFAIKTRDENENNWSNIDTTATEPQTTPSNTAPSAFSLSSPANGSVVSAIPFAFDWADATDSNPSDIVKYELWYSTLSNFSVSASSAGLSASNYSVTSALIENATYWWKVKAYDLDNAETWSTQTWSIMVSTAAEPPVAFSLTSPSSAQQFSTTTVTLDWSDSSDPDPNSSITYTLYYSTYSNFSTSTTVSSLTTSQQQLSNLDEGTTYYWKVVAVDNTGLKTNSTQQSWYFYIKNFTPPQRLTQSQISADDVLSDTGGKANVSWNYTPPPDIAGYRIYWAYNQFTSTTQALSYTTSTSSWTIVTGLTIDTTPYYFAVAPVDTAGNFYGTSLVSTGPVYAVNNTIGSGGDWVIDCPYSSEIKVDVTPNTNTGIVVNITLPATTKQTKINTADTASKTDKKIVTTTVDLLKKTATEINSNTALTAEVTIVLSYKDYTVDTNTENKLRIYKLDETNNKWTLVAGKQTVDKTAKTVSVKVSQFSIYRIIGAVLAADDLTAVKVYPNPYKPGATGADAKFSDPQEGTGVVFDRLTAKANIKVYNIAGELVAELD
ncbi:MAG: FG-GAP-like repeat-containing protein, partial [Candidatus Auribacterota bacterium]